MNAVTESLVETDDATATIETTADVLKPAIGYARNLVDECKLHVDGDGLYYLAVDPSNVGMVSAYVPAACFETYDVDETTIGLDLAETMGALRLGRQSQQDTISLNYSNEMLQTSVHRDYDGTALSLEHSFKTIDPGSIREEPDPPELSYPATATIPRDLFGDVVESVGALSDRLRFANDGDDLVFVVLGGDDDDSVRAVVDGVVDGGSVDSLFSLDYLETALSSFAAIGADQLTFHFGEEIPVRIEWEVELNEDPVTGYWLQAPRIRGDDL